MSKRFRSFDFNFTPTAMSAAMGAAGVKRPLHFSRTPKAMASHADGKRVVLSVGA